MQVPLSLAPDTSPELAEAYAQVFTSAYGSMVLRDLARQCGFAAALPPDADGAMLKDHNARRAVFGRIYEILRLSPAGRDIIAWALMSTDQQETNA